jgi:hypothetical protein
VTHFAAILFHNGANMDRISWDTHRIPGDESPARAKVKTSGTDTIWLTTKNRVSRLQESFLKEMRPSATAA